MGAGVLTSQLEGRGMLFERPRAVSNWGSKRVKILEPRGATSASSAIVGPATIKSVLATRSGLAGHNPNDRSTTPHPARGAAHGTIAGGKPSL